MKVIAIINKPRSCSGCPFNHIEISYEECRLSKRQLSEAESLLIPEWCPLKSLPHKLQADWYTDGYKEGFNACLEEIKGDEDVLHE